MANDGKFLNIDSATGLPKQEAAIATSAGAGDANKLAKLDSNGRFDISMMPTGIGAETTTVTASEALSAGDLVNVYSNAGTLNARKADGSAAGKPADGFVLAAVSNGAAATVYPEEAQITGLSGLTVGGDCFLSTSTPGAIQQTVPSGANKVCQLVGKALNATTVLFRRGQPMTLA